MPDAVAELVRTAGRLANAGRLDEAEQAWLEVRRLQPGHPKALLSLGIHALTRQDLPAALELLRAARNAAPTDLTVLMALWGVCRQQADAAGECEAIEAALALDPYCLPALLAKAAWLERQGEIVQAARTYTNCLQIAPPESGWPPGLKSQLLHARDFVARHVAAYEAFLEQRLAGPRTALPASQVGRWREAASIFVQKTRPYFSACNQLHVPRLPAIPFFERELFDWCQGLEARTDVIRDELTAMLEHDRRRFSPYIAYAPGQPLNQWKELNDSDRWSALHLWRNGTRVEETLERCPETARALSAIPLADIDGLCPNAMFSVLAPHTRIPPHSGETNARVIVHLPLIVPSGCWYRVGFDERRWKVGEALIFDDSIEHEARNDSDEVRVILMFDVWNPLLGPAEREMVRAMSAAALAFGKDGRPAGA